MEQTVNIKFGFKLGKSFTETFELMKKDYGDDCLSRTRVFEWYKRFQDGRNTLEDDPKPTRQKNHEELVEKVREIISYDANSTEMAEKFNTTKDMILRNFDKGFKQTETDLNNGRYFVNFRYVITKVFQTPDNLSQIINRRDFYVSDYQVLRKVIGHPLDEWRELLVHAIHDQLKGQILGSN